MKTELDTVYLTWAKKTYTMISFSCYSFLRHETNTGCCFVTFATRSEAMAVQDKLHNIKVIPGVSFSSFLFSTLILVLLLDIVHYSLFVLLYIHKRVVSLSLWLLCLCWQMDLKVITSLRSWVEAFMSQQQISLNEVRFIDLLFTSSSSSLQIYLASRFLNLYLRRNFFLTVFILYPEEKRADLFLMTFLVDYSKMKKMSCEGSHDKHEDSFLFFFSILSKIGNSMPKAKWKIMFVSDDWLSILYQLFIPFPLFNTIYPENCIVCSLSLPFTRS